MPERWSVAIDHPDPARVRPHHLHAMVSRWLDRDHWAGTKPYSLVPLHEGDDGCPTFEVGCLSDEASERLAVGVARFRTAGGMLGGLGCGPVDSAPRLRQRRSWEEMAAVTAVANDLAVRFETPTTFRSGNLHHPLPLLSSVVRSWNQRWQSFAPPPLAAEVELNASRHRFAVFHLEGATETWTVGEGEIAGFVGEVRYRCHEPSRTRRAVLGKLLALASVAEFAGTGSGTTRGFGVTSMLPPMP